MDMQNRYFLLEEPGRLPVRAEYDVLVAGGGTAGVIAALAAAKNGARTALVEQNTFLGGAMLGGGVIWMGFYNIYKPYGKEPVQLIRGIPDLLRRRLEAVGGSTGFYEEEADAVHESCGLHADREMLPAVLLEMMEEYGVEVYLRTPIADALVEDGKMRGVIIQSKSGREALLARATVDCTGGDVAYKAGAPCREIPERRSGGMIFGLNNVDFEKARAYLEERGVLAYLGYADKGGSHQDRITRIGFKLKDMEEFEPYREKYHLHQEPCIVSVKENQATMVNGVSMNFNTIDPAEYSRAATILTGDCIQMARLFKRFLPGFENSCLDWLSPTPGLRFGRMVECDYDISREDIDNEVIPEDAIGLYGIQDAHYMGYDIKGGWYGIPYRALLPKKIENLLVAGKCISSDWVVWMSTRMVGASFLQGQGAGTAAALAAKKEIAPRGLDPQELRAALLKDGAYLGENAGRNQE